MPSVIVSKSQTRLAHFIYGNIAHNLPKRNNFMRFRNVGQTTSDDYAKGILPQSEWDMHHTLPKFSRYFNNVFEMNDLSYFDKIQDELEI